MFKPIHDTPQEPHHPGMPPCTSCDVINAGRYLVQEDRDFPNHSLWGKIIQPWLEHCNKKFAWFLFAKRKQRKTLYIVVLATLLALHSNSWIRNKYRKLNKLKHNVAKNPTERATSWLKGWNLHWNGDCREKGLSLTRTGTTKLRVRRPDNTAMQKPISRWKLHESGISLPLFP